jgi:NAD(P)-dependent dehydrogenase (short-subunit alcohol dehydrogenase family)
MPRPEAIVLAGGTGRVGGATLATLVARGAHVALLSRDAERARAAIAREIPEEAHERASVVAVDLTDPADAQRAIDQIVSRFGRIDAAISLAGGGSAWTPIADSTPAMLAEAIRNNLEVAFNLMIPALRAMLAVPWTDGRSRGRLLAVTAGSSLDPAPTRGVMGIGKAGVNTLMRAIAREHKADGIVANAVILGGVATEAARAYYDEAAFAAAASPHEVADVLAFHASDASSGINGELIHLNAREVD